MSEDVSAPVRILFVEDRPEDVQLCLRELRKGGLEFEHSVVDTEEAYTQALRSEPDVVLSDFALPQFDGLRALQILQQSGLDIPFIVVSGSIGEEAAVQSMKMGATDYLLKDRLARLSESVKRALRERDLREEQKRAGELERMNAAKNEFLSRMSHELRTPLNAILGFAQLIQLRAKAPEDREDVDQILGAGRHLLDLIDEVLDITSIEAGRLALSIEPVEVCELIGEALDLMRPLAAEWQVALPKERPQGPGLVMADPQRLLQVLLNLLSNAVKYNRPGGSVKVTCEPTGDTTLVTVTDTGHGIAPDKMAELFKPFERLGAEASGVEGTGLGLALSKSLVEAMEGRLGASSEPQVGTTLWFRLPTVLEGAGRQKPATPPVLEAPAALPAQPADILYIEDNLSNLKLLQNLFRERPQFKLMSAMQGRLGLELARAGHPKVILLDLHLPDLGGEDVLAELQRGPQTKAIPVIVISADASPQTAERVLAAGASFFVPKPLDLRRFLTALSEVLA